MERKVRLYGDPVLRQKAKPILDFDELLRALIDEMTQSMYRYDGTGLAAPQVGIGLRLMLVDIQDGSGPTPMINPELIEASEETVKGEEGCLSFPDIYEDIERPKWVCVRYQDGSGKEWEKRLEGFGARVISHEMDHLDGVLMIDHLSHLKRKMLRKRLDIIREKAREIIQSLESGIPEA